MDDIISKCASSTYALRILRANVLQDIALFTVCNVTTISRLLYAAPAWWGCASAADRERVERFLRKLQRAGYSHKVNFDDLIKPAEKKLLCKVKNYECHILLPLFPPLAQRSHSLRPRAHDFVLPRKDDKNYIPRVLYRLSNNVVKWRATTFSRQLDIPVYSNLLATFVY